MINVSLAINHLPMKNVGSRFSIYQCTLHPRKAIAPLKY